MYVWFILSINLGWYCVSSSSSYRWINNNSMTPGVPKSCPCVSLLPIQTSPKHPWPSLSSSRRDSRGISQASLASPCVWGLTVGQTVVSLWQSPSACSVIKWHTEMKRLHHTQRCHTHTHESLNWLNKVFQSSIDSFHLMVMQLDTR